MKTRIILILLVFISQTISAQKYISKNGHIWFYASTPLENIEAHNNQTVSILNPEDGTLQFSILIKSFEFKVALMQEHFNENYMESDKIPKAGFTGKLTNFRQIDFNKDGTYQAEFTGDLTIHGVTKSVSDRGTLTVSGKTLHAKAKFIVLPKDYNIVIPAVVENKIAKEIEVNVDVTYNQY
jgi:polyisoprenoid-binding protein YceI